MGSASQEGAADTRLQLITMEKTSDAEYPAPDFKPNEAFLKTQPGHHDFARKFRELPAPLRTPSGRASPAAAGPPPSPPSIEQPEKQVAMLEVPEGWHTAWVLLRSLDVQFADDSVLQNRADTVCYGRTRSDRAAGA